MIKPKRKGSKQIFMPSWLQKAFISVLVGIAIVSYFIALAFLVFATIMPIASLAIGIFATGCLLFGFRLAYLIIFKTQITIDEKTLGVSGGLYSGSAEWDIMLKFGWAGGIGNKYLGIYTSHDIQRKSSLLLVPINFIPLSHIVGRPSTKNLGVLIATRSVNLEKFKKTDLGQELYYHAPHLFEEFDE